ncbi:hypothetical protein NE670_18500 [Flavonifractor plautii]|uniref:hypothetical protein n=1 Tax=Flavonifractor plautii TaxID=292800 RepID=UPI00210CB7EA|nr:hypothetical protein [Flavonifractor plautii]MCQ4787248.1 hypothetical protein [Flavonifractor plautii]
MQAVMTMNIKTYSELITLPTFEERFCYLKLEGSVGKETFGFKRWLNQEFYHSDKWLRFRDEIIIRDEGCDLGVPGYEIFDSILIHHLNPITYSGEYEVVPNAFNTQVLPTANKVLKKDIVVQKVPYFETSNNYDGVTVYIAEEVNQIEGACTFDVDSTDATAVAAEILFGKTAYVSGNKLTGTMKNNGAVTKKITTRDEEVTIPQGFHDGSGKVGIDATEKGKLIANNIREGVTILGVEGTMSGSENMKPQAKTVTPSTAKQTILPDTEYNCLSQVEVEAIPYVEADNPAGGVTVTIAG